MKQKLSAAADYQKDSIISKNILKNSAGNITLFSLDEGQSISEHTAPFDAFLSCTDGTCEVRIGELVHVLERDEYIILPADIPHAIRAVSSMKFLLVMLKAH
jgi:quercetin dioxygenase-like cupin family protein